MQRWRLSPTLRAAGSASRTPSCTSRPSRATTALDTSLRRESTCRICRSLCQEPRGRDVHGDAICVDPETHDPERREITFEPFVGVGPSRFLTLFEMPDRKDRTTGKVLPFEPANAVPRIDEIEPLDMLAETQPYVKRERRRVRTSGARLRARGGASLCGRRRRGASRSGLAAPSGVSTYSPTIRVLRFARPMRPASLQTCRRGDRRPPGPRTGARQVNDDALGVAPVERRPRLVAEGASSRAHDCRAGH